MEIKIYQLNECDWWAAESLEEAIKDCIDETGLPYDETIENPHELTDNEMDTLMHSGDDGGETPITFRARLAEDIAKGVKFPCLFASTEF